VLIFERIIETQYVKVAIKVLFWNINRESNFSSIQLCTDIFDADILILAESFIPDNIILQETGLKKIESKLKNQLTNLAMNENNLTPKLYARINIEHYNIAVSGRLSFYLLDTIEYGEIILASIHFPSKLFYDGASQSHIASLYSKWIKEIEAQRKHSKTILIGDFNMNPFEQGMIEPNAFNATLSYLIAKSGKRRFHFDDYEYFYNPMWNWLGDREHSTGNYKLPGSYYYKSTSDVSQIYWNVFDKVIVRPSIIDVIDYSSLKIIDVIPNEKLKTNIDHLPIRFQLIISAK
jgi:hypothetical protein